MPLPSSGAISLNQIHIEAGGSSGTTVSLNDSDIRDIIGKGSGASNSFSEYYGTSASSPSVSYRGRSTTTSDGFPTGYINLSNTSGSKVIAVCLQLGGPNNTYCTAYTYPYNSTTAIPLTLAAKVDAATPVSGLWGGQLTSAIYYAETTATGTIYISGNGGSGRSSLTVYEITGYNSKTPYTTDTQQQTGFDLSETITVSSQYNGLTIGAVMSEDSASNTGISITNADAIEQVHLELATSHTSWYDSQTPSGNRSYTITQTPYSNFNNSATIFQIATASWK